MEAGRCCRAGAKATTVGVVKAAGLGVRSSELWCPTSWKRKRRTAHIDRITQLSPNMPVRKQILVRVSQGGSGAAGCGLSS